MIGMQLNFMAIPTSLFIFALMKIDVGKSKETRVSMKNGRMEMGSIFILYIQPTIT